MKLAKAYTPNDYEPTTYALWESSGVFEPKGKGTPYSIVMPPPNANGNLHLGHALMADLEDMLVRYHRMKGFDAVYIPGADHAGFETWVVYERVLEKEGKTRFDFSREQLYSQVWEFVDKNRGNMELQLRALGAGASWKDLVFTLDKKVIDTTYATFKKLWDEKLIYRGERIVNYCTKHQTTFSDIEVEHRDEKSTLWNIAYPTLETAGEIVVATTRPETMLGDVAVAVNPKDERYKHLVGTKVLVPIVNREIPIIADDYVDMSYGTGAVKITPAHDPNDFDMAQRHNLEPLTVIGRDGRMTNVPAAFMGLTVTEARHKVLAALTAEEYRRGETEIVHAVGHCYKCGTIIEPLVYDQWFVSLKPLAQKAIAAIESDAIHFVPANKGKQVIDYLKNIRDWNISRQIPWGIPIPAFYNANDHGDWIFSDKVDEERIVVNGTTYIRDEDTFDTWFSSSQWPYIVTDYLSGGDLANYYPTDVMETGFDILYQWVARMIMMGLYRTDKVPFKNVYLHGLVNDAHNQKMSKSKGNVINPMEIVAEYGSDALRLGLISNRTAAQSQAFSTATVVAGRNFCNKLWNIARYIEDQVGQTTPTPKPEPHGLADHWIMSRLHAAVTDIDRLMADYRFSEAAETLYHTVWDDVADWYIEASKVDTHVSMLAWVLDTVLRITHPFAPFVTETIWQTLSWTHGILAGEQWPAAAEYSDAQAAEFERLKALVTEVRYVTSELPGNDKYALLYANDNLVASNVELISKLARVTGIEHVDTPRGMRLAASGRDAWLDISAEKLYEHQTNLEKRLAATRKEAEILEARLGNEGYVAKAPAELVEESRKVLADKQATVERLEHELEVIA